MAGGKWSLGWDFWWFWLERGCPAPVNISISIPLLILSFHPLPSGLIHPPSLTSSILPILLPQQLFWDVISAASRENPLKIELEGSVRVGRAGWRLRRPLGVRNSRPRCFLIIFRSVFRAGDARTLLRGWQGVVGSP